MNFDSIHILLFGYTIYEPTVVVSNILFFLITLYSFRRLKPATQSYFRQMRYFIFTLGSSSLFGGLLHTVQYQMGLVFFTVVFVLMNILILLSVYNCFRAPYTLYLGGGPPSSTLLNVVLGSSLAMFAFSCILQKFVLMEAAGGIALVYSFVIHLRDYLRHKQGGSAIVCVGIGISFVSFLAHLSKLSLHEWFNYKDISHLIMIISAIVIYRGVSLNLKAPHITGELA